MSCSPLEFQESLEVGQVDFVSPDEIKIQLNIDAPEDVSLSTGLPRVFPRINGYVLIHTEDGYVVGQIEWITIEKSPYPKRQGLGDFGLVDLPFPMRKMSVKPLGVLREKESSTYSFQRGVSSFPSVGDNVLLPTEKQLKAIIESGENRFVEIGFSPFAESAKIAVDPDKLFGRHLAVLGNTGSGKSCSVAGLIRWSLEAAKKHVGSENPNARFIILDPNGEYKKAFAEDHNVRYFSVNETEVENRLKVPLWFWNSNEWCAFAQASGKSQKPTLINTLRSVRSGIDAPIVDEKIEMRRYISTIITALKCEKNCGNPWGSFPKPKNFHDLLLKWNESFVVKETFSESQKKCIAEVNSWVDRKREERTSRPDCRYPIFAYSHKDIDDILTILQNAYIEFGGVDLDVGELDADIPRPFSGESFLKCLSANAEILKTSEYISVMETRIKTLLSDVRMKSIADYDNLRLDDWLNNYIGDDSASNGTITIIDLSLVPAELIHILTAVIARMTFEALQRYRKKNEKCLPTVLVMEEAHTFVKRYTEDAENQSASEMCCKVFEKIAREGRKFGLGMVLSSQRPSELSPTVLSQCNTFLLHRISNDRDQELVMRLIPDNQKGLLRDLPSLPSQNAILLGWASELPMFVKMRYLPKNQRPQSDDPDFWNVWTRKDGRPIDWTAVANEWQGAKTGLVERS